MPVVPPAAQSEKAQMDAADADARPPATQDASPGTPAAPSSGTPAAPSPERAVIPADAKPEKDATQPLSELAKAPAKHPDVHPHTDMLDDGDDDDLDSNDAVSGQSPVDAKPAPAADGAEKPPAADGVEKSPSKDGAKKPPAEDGAEKPPAADGAEKPPSSDGTGKAAAADGASSPPAAGGASNPPAAGGVQNPPDAGAEPAPKDGAKQADKFNDQGLEEPTAPPPGITHGPAPPSKADPKPPSKADPPSKPKPKPDAPPPTTQEIQDALDRIYANANKDDADRQRLANGHDTELQIPYRALGIVVLVFVAFFLGVRWKRRPRYGGYSQVSVVEVREELPVAVKPRHYRD